MIFAQQNGRKIPKEDKIFAISGRAKKMISEIGKDEVCNATIGALLDDDGNLAILSSVMDAFDRLEPVDFAEYAPIGGTPDFKESVCKAAFGGFTPTYQVEVCATPGGTGAIRNTVSNYSKVGDKVLTSDWFWAPYGTICSEIGREITTYQMFDGEGNYNVEALLSKGEELIEHQGDLLILLNTPAHNPTGYSLTGQDWDKLTIGLNRMSAKGRITLFVDVAYVDFAGDEEEYRSFLPMLERLNDRVLTVIGYSASKTLTLYGMRCGAMICMTPSKMVADEFKQVTEFSSRGSWSNSVRAAQRVLSKIYEDEELLMKVAEERRGFREMLIRRGKVFQEALRESGVYNVPFDAGFFTCIETDKGDEICKELEGMGIFTVPLAKGIRISVASISEEKCVIVAKAIAAVMK